MKIEEIKNPHLLEQFQRSEKASATITADAEDALEESTSDAELVVNWQSKLEELRLETGDYWANLEKLKEAV